MVTVYTTPALRTSANEPAIKDAAIAVEGETIAWVGAAADLPADYADATTVAYDSWVVPGLIDTHVHLAFDGGPDPVERMTSETENQQIVLMLRSARHLLSAGVTTARDLGARKYLDVTVRDAIDAGDAPGPRMLTSGAPLTTTGGHCWYMGGEADGKIALRKRVREHHQAGVNAIKIMSTGGFMTAGSAPWNPQFTDEEFKFAFDDAHRLGLPVAAHAHGTEGIRAVTLAGVDMIEHCSFVASDGTFQFDPEVAALVAERDVAVSTTMNVRLWGLLDAEERPAFADHFVTVIAGLREAGVRVVVGTDAGIDFTPHYAYAASPLALHRLGMTTQEAFAAATIEAAKAIGLGNQIGTLEVGKSADFIVVADDPISDLNAIRRPSAVVSRGRAFHPETFPDLEQAAGAAFSPTIGQGK